MTLNICEFPRTKHADQRMAQRCIAEDALNLVLQYGKSSPAGGKRKTLRLEKTEITELLADGTNRDLVTKAQKIEAIVAADGTVVTTYQRPNSKTNKFRHAA
jgi:hypothetical protein